MKRRSHLVHGWLTEAFPDEPIYSEALHTSEDVLCSGSEDEAYNSPTERRERYEDKGQRFLQGKPLFLLSASLRGPFTKESGWKNPWRSQTGGKRRIESQAASATPGPVEESIVITATPTILGSALHGTKEQSPVHEEASSRSTTPTTPHRYLDDETLREIRTWQKKVEKQSELEDPYDETTYEPSSPDTLKSLQVEITPRTHGSRPFIVSSSAVVEEAVKEDPVEHDEEDIAEQDGEVNLRYEEEEEEEEEEEAGLINVDEEDDSSLTDLDEEQFQEPIGERNTDQEAEEDGRDEDEHYHTAKDEEEKNQEQNTESQQISASLPVQYPSDDDSPTKRPIASQPLPQPNGKLDLRPREELGFLPVDTIDLSPTAVKIYEASLRGSTCYTTSWRAQERRKQGNLLPGLVGAALPADNAAQRPSSRLGRSLHASASDSILHNQKRPNKNGSVTLEHKTIGPPHMLVDNQPSEPEETKDSPNEPSDTPAHHQQITVAQPESPQRIISTTGLPQPNTAIAHIAPETTEGEQKSHTTDPTSASSSEISSPATSFEEEEEEPIEEPAENVRKLLWPKIQRQTSTQDSTPNMALGEPPETASYVQAGPRQLQNGSVSASGEHDAGQASLESFTINQQPENDRAPTTVELNGLDWQSPSRLLQSQPQSVQEATVSEESIYDDTINQVRLEWPVGASSLPPQFQVQNQHSIPMASIEEASLTEHDTPAQHIAPEQAKRSVNIMDLRHITNSTSRNATPLRPSSGLQKPSTQPLRIPVLVQPRSSVTPEAPVIPESSRPQLSTIASRALAQAFQPVVQQSPWAKGDSQITALAAPAPEPRSFNPVSSPLSSPASSSYFVDMENPVLPVLSNPPVPGNDAQPEEHIAVPPARAQTPQVQPPHPPSTPETKRSSLPTPEFTMSIKSFKHFMTPSPQRPVKRPRLSLGDGRLPDTQALKEAVVTNPWDSSRLDAGTMPDTAMPSAHSRLKKRVSWAPLPGEVDYMDPDMSMDIDVDMEVPDQPSSVNRTTDHQPGRSILSTSASTSNYRGIPRRAASPPPSFSMPSVDSPLPKESQRFEKHFAAMSSRRRLAPRPVIATPAPAGYRADSGREAPMLRDVSGNARSTDTSRLAKRLLPSESQQTCGSPAVDGMANAFVQADWQVENLNFNNRHQHQHLAQADIPLTGKGIWQDPTDRPNPIPEQQQKDNDAFPLPTLPGFDSQPQSQFQETDEVTEVMDNLDDFIDSWDIDEELAEARGEKSKRKTKAQPQPSKLGQRLSTGLGDGRNLWDSPSSRPRSALKRKRTIDGGDGEDGGNTGAGGGGGGIYDPGVWDRIV
ncbi:hypothetical protein SMACR_07784 [Sordaria macrospora]|uniref:Uncharacterized protein n=1 Tax=Sordaria macrospora TaxID=5147 RepID=A0A8S8ZPJ1_SORMA|nr:hypothetical protein SMACR_07784 [Sordaria macrospora]KAH7635648.1 hypothetical protein B0T09DRAFT_370790 [Sordaria sp. MPI-SDFR-AT-0083]WPJ64147.1 hypothetical protein SMAC4_07784 [Sordaria macrospora]